MNNPETLRCYTDQGTATLIVDTAKTLGICRGYRGPFYDDPAVRLHLLASLQRQLRRDLLDTACDARELGYTSDELLIILAPETSTWPR
jgi:hypothetical protein